MMPEFSQIAVQDDLAEPVARVGQIAPAQNRHLITRE